MKLFGLVSIALLLAGGDVWSQSLSRSELDEKLALFGPGFIVERIEAPVIYSPYEWINRRPGDYVYRFVYGSDDGNDVQVETHIPDRDNPDSAWRRQIGDDLVESFVSANGREVRITEEVDHEHGFRIVMDPGIHLPVEIQPGDAWDIRVKLRAYDTEDGSFAYDGELEALHSYEGAFRVRTPAGTFDAVLFREDFKLKLGPLKAEDDRLLFFARGVGLVAEEEAIRASALFVYREKSDSAKVLVRHPPPRQPESLPM